MTELSAPCHNWATLNAAITSGADAVYFGVKKYNMRMNAENFSTAQLAKITKHCHSNKVKAYLALNTIIYENEMRNCEEIIKISKKAGIDAVIIHDLGLIPLLKKYEITFHISTQASVSNSNAAQIYRKLGAKRIILARECSLKQMREIIRKNKSIEFEAFIHGAMCVSISGRCLLSQALHQKSANRGECMQPCRREWTVTNETGKLVYDGKRFLNAKDLCSITILPEILKTGIRALKIEGRMKDANYVSTVVKVYREALDNYNKKRVPEWLERLKSVYSRGFSTGFYKENPGQESINYEADNNASPTKKEQIGIIKNYYPKSKAAEILLLNSGIREGDEIIIEGSTTFLKQCAESLQVNHENVKQAKKGSRVALKVQEKVRKNDNVYKLKKV